MAGSFLVDEYKRYKEVLRAVGRRGNFQKERFGVLGRLAEAHCFTKLVYPNDDSNGDKIEGVGSI
jgi:hypothetical protein